MGDTWSFIGEKGQFSGLDWLRKHWPTPKKGLAIELSTHRKAELLKMAHVDLPIINMLIFHRELVVHQRLIRTDMCRATDQLPQIKGR